MLVSLMAFVWIYFGTGDKWLALLWSGASSGLLLWPAVVPHVVLTALLIPVYLSDKAAKTLRKRSPSCNPETQPEE